ncbi:adenosylcobinamide-phosphate synthase CbiB [Nitratireductor kimnyeongensis]|uniref:Cobalamin biosynthesis protein CobD n=1 Tax=Nitratireductor kimnyeongensis TaxID=430679 RepID=A0ABW0TDU8_9HYPH|nr:adenosylcobinamide-phosphate synthase CbiB [Nitratireductor kimnyeongensis]QZZ37585.1 adenosylcobinamide-phosphate synthase CbiB [Nitratireductor kimnyeongensis]
MSILIALSSMLVELAIGYPERLFRLIGHPVTWIGRLIALADAQCNVESLSPGARRLNGALALVVILMLAGLTGWLIQTSLSGWVGLVIAALVGSSLIAQRSLASHVKAVADGLDAGGLAEGRKAVSQIVGRDPESLDEAGVARAAIESLAENCSDGVVAPVFWLAVGGLAGGALYKAANTADSMIGHRSARHLDFGWAAARFDDLINLPASRLTAFLFIAAAFFMRDASAGAAWKAVRRDARLHRSPNAGWPEAAMAGALGLALAGPRRYGGEVVEDAVMGDGGRRAANAGDIRRALTLYRIADGLLIGLVAVAAGLWHLVF